MADEHMLFNLTFPTQHAGAHDIRLDVGETLFVLGANGSGKSSLMFLFNKLNHGHTRKISAHRQTWMQSNALDMTPSSKVTTEQSIQAEDQNQRSRYRDSYATKRASMTIYELIDAENVRAREMASAYDSSDMELLAERAKVEAPLTIINELFRESNILIELTIRAKEALNKTGVVSWYETTGEL